MSPDDTTPTAAADAPPEAGEKPTAEGAPEGALDGPDTPAQTEEVAAGTGDTAAGGADSAGEPPAQGEASAGGAVARDTETAGTETAGARQPEKNAEADAEGDRAKKKRRKRKRRKRRPGEHDAEERHGRERPKPATDRAPFHVGEEVFGRVTAVLDTAIMVDLSGKALGIFDRTEMEPDDLIPEVGDRFLARVHNDGARGGLVVLTRKPLRDEEAKPWVEQAQKDGSLCPGLVTGVVRGGVEVAIGGLRAFAPASGMDLHPAEANFGALIGQRLDFKVVEYEGSGRDVIVTRRPMLEAEAHERRKKALELLEEGQVMKGAVRTVVEWGAFVALPDAQGLEGLVHVSEASHDPRTKMAELFKPGDQIEVKIIKIDERGKIWLSRKALIEDPWGGARKKYAPRSRHVGKVTRVEAFGAFVELESGVEGLMHVADLSFDRIEHANEVVKEGQQVEVVIHHFDPRNKKIALHPAPPQDEADHPPQKVAKGAVVDVQVVRGEKAGLVVRVRGATGRAARGFIPAGHTGTQRGTDLRKKFKQGTQLKAKVLDVDPRRGEPKLSIRVLEQDEERAAHREYRKKLKAEASFGTLGDLLAAAKKS